MSKLEIRYFTGDVDERQLSREHPVSIGRSPGNDVCIDEDDVEPIHCRIAWSGNGYNIAAANAEGIEVNGTLVKNAILRDDDTIRVGTVDIGVAIDDDANVTKTAAAVASTTPPREEFEHAAVPESRPAAEEPVEDYEDDDDDDMEPAGRDRDADPDDGEMSTLERIRRRLDRDAVRPGEREVLRSKFLIGLIAGMAVLGLASGILWFWLNLNAAEKLKATADAEYKSEEWNKAIQHYTQFLDRFPENEFTEEVFYKRAKARVEQEISGSSPKWDEGLKQVNEFITENKDRENFADQHETIRNYAVKIAKGACRSSAVQKQRKYLPTAIDARNLARRYKADKEFEDEFKKLYEFAKAEVERKEAFDLAVKQIKGAIAAKKIDTAIQQRLDLLQRLEDQPRPKEKIELDKLLDQTMAGEMSLILAEDLNRNAITKDRPGRMRSPRTLTPQVRPQESRVSDGSQIVVALAKNCCYGVDALTSAPLWRRVTGRDLPFFPIGMTVGGEALLYFDTDFGELTLIARKTGRLIWRQPLLDTNKQPEQLSGPPLVSEGQIFLPTLSRRLYRLDLNSGRILRRLTFSQRLLGPPVMAPSNDRVIVAGDKALVYTVTLAPQMECKTVTYVGHRAGSVRVPMMRIGQLLLMCENIGSGKNAQCRLRVLNSAAKKASKWLEELTFKAPDQQVRVPGHLLEQPVVKSNEPQMRGKLLFVVSGGKYITVFNVSDDTNQPESERNKDQFLRRLDAPKEFDNKQVGPVYIVTQPNRRFWVVSSELSKFQLATKTIRTPEVVPFNRASQPPQTFGEKFYLGRQGAYSGAVTVSETDPVTMRGTWSLALGAKILAWNQSSGQPIVCLNEEGLVFRVQPQDIAMGGFHVESTTTLPIPRGMTEPLRAVALPDGGIAAAGGVKKPVVWMINGLGQLVQTIPLPAPLQADPVIMGNGLVLPLKGRLRYLSLKGGGIVQDYQLPFNADKDPPAWVQLAALNAGQLVALTSEGKLLLIKMESGAGKAYLKLEVSRELPDKPQPGFTVHRQTVIVADAKGAIQMLSAATLQPSATAQTGATRVNGLWVAEGYLFAETDRASGNGVERQLQFYSIENGLKKMWDKPLPNNTGLAGTPSAQGGQIVVAQRNGQISWVDPSNGKSLKSVDLADEITESPKPLGSELVVPTADGSFLFVPPANGGN